MKMNKKMWLGISAGVVVVALAGVLLSNTDLLGGSLGKGGGKGGIPSVPLTPPTSGAVTVARLSTVPTYYTTLSNTRIGSFIVTALANNTRVNSIKLSPTRAWRNVRLTIANGVSETQVGSTVAVVYPNEMMTFNGALTFTRVGGLSQTFNLYADSFDGGCGDGDPSINTVKVPQGGISGSIRYDARTSRDFYSPTSTVTLQTLMCGE
jgi:hypothetical protein